MYNTKQSSTLNQLFWKYFILMLLPILLITTITIGSAISGLKANINDFNNNVIEQVKQSVDYKLSDFVDISVQLSRNDIIKDRISRKELTNYDLHIISKELSRYSNKFSSIGIYIKETDTIVTNNAAYTFAEYYNFTLSSSGYSAEWWNKNFQTNSVQPFIYPGGLGANQKQLIFLKNLNKLFNEQDITLIAEIRADEILSNVSNVLGDDVNYSIANKYGIVFLESDNFATLKEPENNTIVETFSNDINIKYVFSYKHKNLSENPFALSTLFVSLIFLALIISILLARFNIGKITEIFNTLSVRNKELTQITNEQADNAREQYLHNLIYNNSTNDDWMADFIEKYNINIKGHFFYILIIQLASTSDTSINILYDMRKLISDKITEMSISPYYARLDDNFAICLGSEHTLSEYSIGILSNKIREVIPFEVKISIGTEVHTVEHLYKSYDTALIALYACNEQNKLCIYNENYFEQLNSVFYPNEMNDHLVQCIMNADRDNMLFTLNELYSLNFEKHIAKFNLKRVIATITVSLYSVVDLLFKNNPYEKEKYLRVFQNILQTDKDELSFNILKETCCKLCSISKESEQSDIIKTKIEGYINTHYMFYDVSLQTLAENMNMNYYYLSKIFKEKMGCTFSQYMQKIRLEKAQHLLNNTELPIKEIALQVGFSDSNTFIKNYKSRFGISPGKYRTNKIES